jgi:hypothetical protein
MIKKARAALSHCVFTGIFHNHLDGLVVELANHSGLPAYSASSILRMAATLMMRLVGFATARVGSGGAVVVRLSWCRPWSQVNGRREIRHST